MSKTVDTVICVGRAQSSLHIHSVKYEKRIELDCSDLNIKAGERILAALQSFRDSYPDMSLGNTVFLLDESLVLRDTLALPASSKALSHTLSAIYPSDTEIKGCQIEKHDGNATYAVMGVKKDIISAIKSIPEAIAVIPMANSIALGAGLVNSKLKKESFSLLNIEEDTSYLIFVKSTKVLGSYRIPLGRADCGRIFNIASEIVGANTWLSRLGDFNKIYVNIQGLPSVKENNESIFRLTDKAIDKKIIENLGIYGAIHIKLRQKDCEF